MSFIILSKTKKKSIYIYAKKVKRNFKTISLAFEVLLSHYPTVSVVHTFHSIYAIYRYCVGRYPSVLVYATTHDRQKLQLEIFQKHFHVLWWNTKFHRFLYEQWTFSYTHRELNRLKNKFKNKYQIYSDSWWLTNKRFLIMKKWLYILSLQNSYSRCFSSLVSSCGRITVNINRIRSLRKSPRTLTALLYFPNPRHVR